MDHKDTRAALAGLVHRAVVTGGAGFIGSHLCDELVAAGCHVVCVDNFCTGRRENIAHLIGHPCFELLACDVSEGLEVAGPVDVVLHLASPASPADYGRLPLETLLVGSMGTRNAIRIALNNGARFVLTSTSEIYGDPLEHPQREDYWGNVNPIGPRAVYDEAKRYAEAMVSAYAREHGVNTGIARIFNTYGPRMRSDDGRAIPTFIRQALTGEPLTINDDGHQTRSLCYVDDTVAGILALACSDYHAPINIGNPSEITVIDLAMRIRDLVGGSAPLRFVDPVQDDPRRRQPNIDRAREALGWAPCISLTDGLRRTVASFAGDVERPAPTRS
jgi:dTDP-glucose 4,6-dehydratase